MKILETKLKGLYVSEVNFIRDKRGSFGRIFCKDELRPILNDKEILQVNISSTKSCGAVRGMHYQNPPHCEMKLVRCLKGKVYDVAIDIRKSSKTFLHWHAEELSEKNRKMMVIPEGFAHGFQALEDDTQLLYLHTNMYYPNYEDGLLYDDPLIDISWPLPVIEVSERDKNHSFLTDKFSGITI